MEGIPPLRRAQEFVGSLTALNSLLHLDLGTNLLFQLAGTSLTLAQLRLLALVDHQAHWSIGEVAACLRISDAAASKIVDRLVRHHLLHRTEGQEDRRVADLALTDKGRQLLQAYYAARDSRLTVLLNRASPEEMDSCTEFLDRLSVEVRKQSPAEDLCLHCGMYHRERCLLREQAPELCFYTQSAMPKRAKRRDRHGNRHS
jgi:DNA-binding MarR family transcriptional regulator